MRTMARCWRPTKKENKRRLARWMEGQGLYYDPARMLDVQIKRLHEYKRQLLHCLGILALTFQIEQGEITEFAPTTFFCLPPRQRPVMRVPRPLSS